MPTYTNTYMPSGFAQDQGLFPVFQNIAQQQANQNAALAQQNQQVQQAGQNSPQGSGNAMALAQMLRNQNGDAYKKGQAQQAMNQYGSGNVYGYGGQGQIPNAPTNFDEMS